MKFGINNNKGKAKVLGGEMAPWTEQADEIVLDSKVWAHSAAAAEVFWSASYDKERKHRERNDIWLRMNDWRFRLAERGIGTGKCKICDVCTTAASYTSCHCLVSIVPHPPVLLVYWNKMPSLIIR